MSQEIAETEEEDELDFQVAGEEDNPEGTLDMEAENHPLGNKTDENGEMKVGIANRGAVIKRLAEDTYDEDDVALRELLANAETACKEAESLVGDNYSPVIEIEYQEDGELTFYDNGTGIQGAVFDKVFRQIQATMHKDDGDVSGQMGMGVYSIRNIMGEESKRALITTHSRKSEENYAMYMRGDKFIPVTGETLGDNEYGTKFVIPTKDSFDARKIRRAIEKYAQFLDVPVIYTEYDRRGKEIHNEEYGLNELEDQYDDDTLTVTYEDEFVKVVMSTDSNQRTLLCNMPIERNDKNGRSYSSGTYRREASKSWDLKLKYEDGRELGDTGLNLPEPTSDRDRLSTTKEGEIFEWCSKRVEEVYEEKLYNSFDGLSDAASVSKLAETNPNQFQLLIKGISKLRSYNTSPTDLKNLIANERGVDVTEDAARLMLKLSDNMDVARRGEREPNLKDNRETRKLSDVILGSTDGEVFMCKSVNAVKTKTVWELDENHMVVRLESGSSYSEYERLLGWSKLKDVDPNEHKDKVDKDLKLKIENSGSKNAGRDAEKREVIVRRGTKARRKPEARKVVEDVTNGTLTAGGYRGSEKGQLVLFGYNSDYKISAWTEWLNETGFLGAKANTKMVDDYLMENTDGEIMHIDSITTDAEEIEVSTVEGDVKLGEEQDRLVLHAVKRDTLLEKFREDEIMEAAQEIVEANFEGSDDERPLYAPIDRDGGVQLKAGIKDMKITVIDYSSGYDFSRVSKTIDGISSSAEFYAICRLHEWDETSDEVEFIRTAAHKLKDNIIDSIEMFAKFHDADVDPASELAGEIEFTVNERQTSLGETVTPADD